MRALSRLHPIRHLSVPSLRGSTSTVTLTAATTWTRSLSLTSTRGIARIGQFTARDVALQKRSLSSTSATAATAADNSSAAKSKNNKKLPLQGIRVLDMTRVLAGVCLLFLLSLVKYFVLTHLVQPYCTQILGDLG